MLGTAGHVDHGKTALVKLLTGCETDTLAEEKQRGLTIDLGFAPCHLADDRIVGIVDVPGHVDFIRNMVAGAHGVDVVILVVAADDGIMPQTREHLHILTLMGLRHGLVALTKIDLVEASRRDEVTADLRRLLAETFLDGAPVCPISNLTGEGYEAFFESLNQVVNACEDRPDTGIFRLWVEDVFTIRGQGTVITGIPSSGKVRVEDTLALLPAGRRGRVRRLQVYGEDAADARAGECVALNIPEIEHDHARRGMLLCASEILPSVTMAEAELRILASVNGKIEDFIEAHLHIGTASVLTRVAMLEKTEMMAGERQLVQLRLLEPLPLSAGERFVLRANVAADGQSGLITIGGGRIVATGNVRLRRKKQCIIDALSARAAALDNREQWCEVTLRQSARPLTFQELQARTLLNPEELSALLLKLMTASVVIGLENGALTHRELVDECGRKIESLIRIFHETNPQRAGMNREEILAAAGGNSDLCTSAIAALLDAKKLEQVGTVFARAGWSARLSSPDQALADQIAAAFRSAGWSGPSAADLAVSLHQPKDRIARVTRLLTERGLLVRLSEEMFIHREAMDSARQVVLQLFAEKSSFSTMNFRDALGVSRKYAVPILDHLDRLRFTVRCGHDRTPGIEARKLLGKRCED